MCDDKNVVGSVDCENDNGTYDRRGNLPRQYIKHLEELVKQNPMIKPAEALGKLKAALGLPAHPFEQQLEKKFENERESEHL